MNLFLNLFHRYLLDRAKSKNIEWNRIKSPANDRVVPYDQLPKPGDTKNLNKLAVLKVNGGLGTTMGLTGAKSALEVKNDLTFLDLIVRQIEHLNTTNSVDVPLILMTSFNTHEDTLAITRKYTSNTTRIIAFSQSKYPKILKETLLPCAKTAGDDKKHWYPPGHGDLYNSLWMSGVLDYLISEGKEYLFVSNSDNLGAIVDGSILQHMVDTNAEFLMEVTDKTRADIKGGTLIDYEDSMRLLEIAQVPLEHIEDFRKFEIFNTNNLWINLKALKRIMETGGMELDIIVNSKTTIDGQAVIELETAAGAAIKHFTNAHGINVPRSRFLPVKSCSDLLLIKSDIYSLENFQLVINENRICKTPPLIQLDDHFKTIQEFQKRFKTIPSIIELDLLYVKGDVSFGRDVTLQGKIIIVANEGQKVDIPDRLSLDDQFLSETWNNSVTPFDAPQTDRVHREAEILVPDFVAPCRQCQEGYYVQPVPNLKLSLDNTLTNYDTEVSPWKQPREWLQDNRNYLNGVAASTGGSHTVIGQTVAMIYRHLIIYIFAKLMLCPSAAAMKLWDKFKNTLQEWCEWDSITVIENHQAIRNHLLDFYRRGLQLCPTSFSKNTLRKLLTLDVMGLCAHLTVLIHDDETYKQVRLRRGPGAQALLNLLQARLDFDIHKDYKERHFKALIRLARNSALYPACLALKGVKIGKRVALGSFGDVYKGFLRDQEIAVKELRVFQKSNMDKLLKQFSSEAVTWRQLDHKNVLPFYGVYHLNRDLPLLCLVSPWMANGNVVDFLEHCEADTDCVALLLDVAQGLEYLHSCHIVHGDMKGYNVLISESQRAYLADFGLAIATKSEPSVMSYMSTTKTTGTLRWQAPELVEDRGYIDISEGSLNTFATDVYAFAFVGYEMFSGKIPFHDIRNDFQVMFAVRRGRRPSRPLDEFCGKRGLDDAIWDLLTACWATEASRRPSCSQIVEKLRALPNRPLDRRPDDNFHLSLRVLSQVLLNEADHPFSALAPNIGDADGRGSLPGTALGAASGASSVAASIPLNRQHLEVPLVHRS